MPRGCRVLPGGSRGIPRGHGNCNGTAAAQLREGKIKTYEQEEKQWEPEDINQRAGMISFLEKLVGSLLHRSE